MPMPLSDSRQHISSRRLALDAALLAAALMLAFLEHQLPLGAWLPLPGFKLGLANLVTVLAFSLLSPADALAVSLLRVGITGVLFGSWTSLFFSFSGACMSFLALLFARFLLRRCSYIGVSVLAAAAHNLGQTLAAAALSGRAAIPAFLTLWLPLLLPAGIGCGVLTGVLLNLSVPRLERWFKAWKNA